MVRMPGPQEGKIYILGAWKLAEIQDLRCDLFWNSASFQEMEPHLVVNYLSYVDRATTRFVFLHERMKGMARARHRGAHGVLQPTTLEHYTQGLPNFQMVDLSESVATQFISRWRKVDSSHCSFWKRRNLK